MTSARPTPTGKATLMPAASMPTTRRMFERLKITPLISAGRTKLQFAWCRFSRVGAPAELELRSAGADQRRQNEAPVRLVQVLPRGRPRRSETAQRVSKYQAEQEHADRVVPIEQLERPLLFARQFLRIGPRSPPEHGDHAEYNRHMQAIHDEHRRTPISRS